ncbi:MAG: hypothetical protein QG641_1361 [Candidatus Poribacteria bacterium]|nr:hypothetical protein [Candidatus Poribacteria bacterium]
MNTTEERERNVVRELARRLAELAHSDENSYRQKLWLDVNSLRKPERPPVICHPGGGAWAESLPGESVICKNPYLSSLEYQFRQTLYKWELGDDTVISPWMSVSSVMRLEGQYFWGLPIGYVSVKYEDVSLTAWRYDPPIKEESDIERIVPPRYHYDNTATQENLNRMHDLLGDILPVKQTCSLPGPGAWLHGWATELRGVQQLLLDLMDRPAWVHRLMRILMEGFLDVMDQYDEMGVLTLNNTGTMACDDLPQTDFDGKNVRLRDLWGRGESQEFQGVSPAQHEEFLIQYQKPILERFGLTYYGCCEDLTNKIPLILSIPNLRKFVCSPWTDIGKLAEAVGDRYVIEWRQKATDVVYASDLTDIRKHLEQGLHLAKGCRIQIVLQELETTNHNPRRLADWSALAKEVGAQAYN